MDLKIGSRGSPLALWQAEWARSALQDVIPGLEVDIEVIHTKGDRVLNAPFSQIGGKGVFIKEIEDALLDRRIDLAVHSLKDLPTELPEGLEIGAISDREDVRDALVTPTGVDLESIRDGARVGTSSLRRRAQIQYNRPDLVLEELRGNVQTRLSKMDSEGMDAVVLAAAGLIRLGLEDRISELLDPEFIIPAPGQGALAIEVRSGDRDVQDAVSYLDDDETRQCVVAERTVLEVLGGGCQVPIGVWARINTGRMVMDGVVAVPDGTQLVRGQIEGEPDRPEDNGSDLADILTSQGADEILFSLD
ncbi:MAG TPA: hydroxymethylbilane synthase [Candidatus Latescibacteria bacterium]|mgnify:CR=1 FL=1|nr:hydroxymethylbilane synthase [Candidatus Latescibacterota bacterium]